MLEIQHFHVFGQPAFVFNTTNAYVFPELVVSQRYPPKDITSGTQGVFDVLSLAWFWSRSFKVAQGFYFEN